MDIALKEAEAQSKQGADGSRAFRSNSGLSNMTSLLGQVPGAGDLAREAQQLQQSSDDQERASNATQFGSEPSQNIPGTNIDPIKTAKQIYPILEFRDKVVKIIDKTIEKIPGLEALVEKITETLTLFVLSLLAPFIRPIINVVSAQLKAGSGGVIDASGKSQYEPWTDPHCSDPTHSLLSKDHFSNVLNEPAGQVASTILQYVAPRIIYAWEHPDVPLEQVLNDITRVFHHPALRDNNCELHRTMFNTVERWARSRPDGGTNLNQLLGSESVRHGLNHTVAEGNGPAHSHGGLPSTSNFFGAGSHSKTTGSPWDLIGRMREVGGVEGASAGAVDNIVSAYPGTQTEYDSSRPPAGPEFGYAAQQPPQQDPYGRPPYSQGYGGPSGYYGNQPLAEPQGYPGQAPPGAPHQEYAQYGPYGSGGAPPYGYDPNARPPPPQVFPGQGPPGPYTGYPPAPPDWNR